jgi:hypothetical protein
LLGCPLEGATAGFAELVFVGGGAVEFGLAVGHGAGGRGFEVLSLYTWI